MKEYTLMRVAEPVDWKQLPTAALTHTYLQTPDSVKAWGQLALGADALLLHLWLETPEIRAVEEGPLGMPCEDSCLEFFFCPEPEGDRYFNFEANPNGSVYVGYGRPGSERCRLHRKNFKEIFQITPFEIPGGWGLELRIPVSFVQTFAPGFSLEAGKVLRANFFKCGDETEQEHYMAWNPVEVPAPNFHLPEFFGELILGA